MTILVLEDIFQEKMQETDGILEEAGVLELAASFLGQIAKNNLKKFMTSGKIKLSLPAIEMFYKLKKLGVKKVGPYKINQVIQQMEKQLGLRKNYAGKYHSIDDDDETPHINPLLAMLGGNAPQVKGGFFDPTGAYRIPVTTKAGKTIFKTLDPRSQNLLRGNYKKEAKSNKKLPTLKEVFAWEKE